MKLNRIVMGVVAALTMGLGAFWTGVSVGQERTANTRVYELRTYTTLPGRLPALNKRFAEHTLKMFEKHGMRNEMYWTPTDAARKDDTLIYVISHESQEAADRSWKAFQSDPAWIKVRDASQVDGTILAKNPERVFMRLTAYSPGKQGKKLRPKLKPFVMDAPLMDESPRGVVDAFLMMKGARKIVDVAILPVS